MIWPLVFALLPLTVVSWSPTGGYAPGYISCPPGDKPLVRAADRLSHDEVDYITHRRQLVKPHLLDFFQRADVDFDYESLVSSSDLTVALSFSGGGYRAMLSGAGTLAALDSRESGSTRPGHLGGLLQSSVYLAGLSGGSWLVGTVYLNNFTTVNALRGSDSVWNFEYSILNEAGNIPGTVETYRQMLSDSLDKIHAGFKVSLTDLWGRALSRQMIDLDDGGPALQWSDMTKWSWFKNTDAPYPIIVANARMPITDLASETASIIEITPFELGSFDPSLYAFSPLKYLGTKVNNGSPQNGKCVSGFDNAGFMFGTSSSVFDLSTYRLLQRIPGPLGKALKNLIDPIIKTTSLDVGIYEPNPFEEYKSPYLVSNEEIVEEDTLYLVDGGEDGQVIPMQPLVHPSREVDVLFAFDYDTDTANGWPNGNSVVKTYNRQFTVQANFNDPVVFPYVPDSNTFINEGLTSRPTFFGCSAANQTSLGERTPPLVVYLANYPYSYWSNTSTFKLAYTPEEANGMIKNGYNMMTQLNGTLADDWYTCVACAIVHRETERRQLAPSPKCLQCLRKYCWDGSTNTQAASNSKFDNPSVLCYNC